MGMAQPLGEDHRADRAGDGIEQDCADRRALGLADQRMMRENIQGQQHFAGDDAVDEAARAGSAQRGDFLVSQAMQVVACFRIAPGHAQVGDEEIGPAGAARMPGHAAPEARVEQIVVGFRDIARCHQLRIVGDAKKRPPGGRPQPVGIAVAVGHGCDGGCGVGQCEAGLNDRFANARAFDDIGDHLARAHFRRELGENAGRFGAPIVHLHEGVFFHEGFGNRAQRLIDDHRRVENDFAL